MRCPLQKVILNITGTVKITIKGRWRSGTKRGKFVQVRAEDKFICTMPNAAEFAQSEMFEARLRYIFSLTLSRASPGAPEWQRKAFYGNNCLTEDAVYGS